jgi:uncharacterized protein
MEQKLFFDNGKGSKLCGILNRPEGSDNKRIVILCHGFTTHKNRPKYLRLAEEFTKKNVATFRFDFFAHGESEGKFEDITISEGANDILKAIELVKSKGFSRIGLIGVSFGGISSAIAASKTKELKALVLVSPVSDYAEVLKLDYGGRGIKEWKETGFIGHKDPKGDTGRIKYSFFEDVKKTIVYDVTHKITVPTHIIHGNEDKSVPVQQSIKTAKLIRNGEITILKGCNHNYLEKMHFERMIKTSVSFVMKNI